MAAIDLLRKRARMVAAVPGGDVPSPCLSVCRMDAQAELCVGCWRTLDEIAGWGRMPDDEKRQVWALLARRIEENAS